MASKLAHRARALALMHEAGIDAVLASAPHNVRYLTGYYCSLEAPTREWMVRPGASEWAAARSLAVFSEHGSALVTGPGFAFDAAATDVEDVRIAGALPFDSHRSEDLLHGLAAKTHAGASRAGTDAIALAAGVLADRGLARTRVGIDRSALADADVAALTAALPQAQLLDCHNLLRLVRMVKSPGEIDVLRRSAAVNERAGTEAARSLRPGESAGQLRHRYLQAVAAEGAEFDHATPTAAGLSFTSGPDYVFEAGETFAFDVGCEVDGYYSDAQFTVTLGDTLAQPVHDRYESVRHCVLDAGIGSLRPGVTASSVQRAMAEALAADDVNGIATGHGIGLEFRDYPILVPKSNLRIRDDCVDVDGDLPLESGMVINVEACIFMAGFAAVGCEVTCVVTESGAVPLTEQDRAQPVLASA